LRKPLERIVAYEFSKTAFTEDQRIVLLKNTLKHRLLLLVIFKRGARSRILNSAKQVKKKLGFISNGAKMK
jgi:hypothetical protein